MFSDCLKGWLLTAGGHLLCSLACLALFYRHVAMGMLPESVWGHVLARFTLEVPLTLTLSLPPSLVELLGWMVVQSLVFGSLLWMVARRMHIRLPQRSYPAAHAGLLLCAVAGGLVVGWFLFALVAQVAAMPRKIQTLSSVALSKPDTKIAWLTKFLPPQGSILATEYVLCRATGGEGSEMVDYQIAIKTRPGDIERWLRLPGYPFRPAASIVPMHFDEHTFIPQGAVWTHTTSPAYYTAGASRATVYRREGIIIFHLER